MHANGQIDLFEVLLVNALIFEVLLKEDEEGRLVESMVLLAHLLNPIRVVQAVLLTHVLLVGDIQEVL
jgi:hypothetical protein